MGGPRIVENINISIDVRGLSGVGGFGGPRIIKNENISLHLHGSGGGVGARAAPESLEIYGFQCIFVARTEEWAALAAPESFKINRFQCILMVRAVGLGDGRPQLSGVVKHLWGAETKF